MFNHFTNKHVSLVEFWMRFESAIEAQRDNERELDNTTTSSFPQLKTEKDLEKYRSGIYTHRNFYFFQDEWWCACMDCGVATIEEDNGSMVYTIVDDHRKSRKVTYNTLTHDAKCSCKMFELEGIPCRHILVVLKMNLLKKIPPSLVLNRWTKMTTTKPIFDVDGVLLEACDKEKGKAQLISAALGHIYNLMHLAKRDEQDLQFVREGCKEYGEKN